MCDRADSEITDNQDVFSEILDIFGKPGYKTFSDKYNKSFSQKDVIASILDKKNTFAIIPTGGGKSICYQAPSLFLDGITIVVSPLVELIHDQVTQFNQTIENYNEKLKKDGKRPFKAVYPGMDDLSAYTIFGRIYKKTEDIETPNYCLLYLSPEKLTNPGFMRNLYIAELNGMKIANIVIDEAHCLSMWGFDFRENYLDILRFINQRKERPIISAFTATVTNLDIFIIKKLLGFGGLDESELQFFKCIAPRKELNFEHIIRCNDDDDENIDEDNKDVQNRQDTVLKILCSEKYREMNTIIYCTTVTTTKELFNYLKSQEEMWGRTIYMYHGAMNKTARSKSAQRFIQSKKGSIIIATKAFGMGIDKPDVHLVIHYDMSLSLEEYYQEVGRAARGKDIIGTSILLYTKGNKETASRGSYEWTKDWIKKQSSLKHFETTIISSRLSNKSRAFLQELPHKRLNAVFYYIKKQLASMSGTEKNNNISDPQDYIIKYLKRGIREKDKKVLNAFLSDLERIIYEINSLHVANSKLANIIRWHPDQYELNKEDTVDIDEWKRKRKKDYDNFIRTDVEVNSAYIRIPGLKSYKQIDHQAALGYIIQGTDLLPSGDKEIDVLYAVSNDASLIIKGAYINDGKWTEDPEDHFVKNKKTVKGILNKQRFQDWREYDPEEYIKHNHDYDFSKAFAYIRGQRSRIVRYKISGRDKLSYFDMCVADTVYSLKYHGKDIILAKDIWKVLSGNLDVRFPRSSSRIETEIRHSLIKLYNTRIYIKDPQLARPLDEERFLPFIGDNSNPFIPASDKKGGFKLAVTPLLYRHSEYINGEIIRIPVAYLRPREYADGYYRYGIKPLMNENPQFSVGFKEIGADSAAHSKNKQKSESVPVIILDEKVEKKKRSPKKNKANEKKDEEDKSTESGEATETEERTETEEINETEKTSKSAETAEISEGIENENNSEESTNLEYVEFRKMKVKPCLRLKGDGRNEYSITIGRYIKDNKKVEKIDEGSCYSVKTVAWRSTIEDSVLLHYLLHRISIALAKKRGEYINFSTIVDMVDAYLPRNMPSKQRKNRVYRKTLAFLCYFERISYIKFLAYVTDFCFLTYKRTKIHTAYFEVRHIAHVKYWRDGDEKYIQFNDILLKWVHTPEECHENFMENKKQYTKETLIRVRNTEINDLDGIRILPIKYDPDAPKKETEGKTKEETKEEIKEEIKEETKGTLSEPSQSV